MVSTDVVQGKGASAERGEISDSVLPMLAIPEAEPAMQTPARRAPQPTAAAYFNPLAPHLD